ncbi:MAG: hypothetical protein ACI32E_04760 [Bacilli bacterium]
MKKALVIILIGAFFLLGISLGGNYNNSSRIFEEAKDNFEVEIQDPNNDYNPKDIKPEAGLINKIANKIDDILEKIAQKLK